MIKRVLAGAALCSVVPAFAAANLVTGASVESAAVAPGAWATFSGSDLPAWLALPGDSIEVRNGIGGTARQGVNFVELDSTHNRSMLAASSTVVGHAYSLSVHYSGRSTRADDNPGVTSGVVPGSSDGLSVSVAGTTVNLVSPANTTLDNLWAFYTATFVGTSKSMSLLFAATGDNDSHGGSLDNVSVTPVPEPTTLAMMGAGLLGLVGLGRRRERAR